MFTSVTPSRAPEPAAGTSSDFGHPLLRRSPDQSGFSFDFTRVLRSCRGVRGRAASRRLDEVEILVLAGPRGSAQPSLDVCGLAPGAWVNEVEINSRFREELTNATRRWSGSGSAWWIPRFQSGAPSTCPTRP